MNLTKEGTEYTKEQKHADIAKIGWPGTQENGQPLPLLHRLAFGKAEAMSRCQGHMSKSDGSNQGSKVLEPRRPEFQTHLYHLVIVYFCTGNLSDFIP